MAEKILITPRSYGKTDLSLFEKLTQAGYELVLNDSGSILDKAQMAARIAPCVGVIVGVDPMDADVIAAAPQLRAIAKYGVGVDNIDLDACKARGIKVSRTVGANAEAVADYAMALMLSIARGVLVIDQKCRAGDWRKMSTHDVSGQTLGLFGLGAIGKLVAQRAQGFGMTVLAYDVYWDAAYASSHDIAYAKPDDILTQADFISLHLPLLPDTQGFIGARELSLMKKDAILINTARGGLIDEEALLDALKAERIGGAGLDAFATEPPKEDWFHLGNVVLGAHCAASTPGATQKMGTMATENLLRDLA